MCTLEKRGAVYLLTLTGATSEHRLNPTLLNSILSSLSHIRSSHSQLSRPPSALVIASEGKFFCNGFDLDWANVAIDTRGPLLSSLLQRVISALVTLPMPTVAAVAGHAAAAGLILPLVCDYVVMRSDRGVLYLSETDIGLQIVDYFVAVLKAKVNARWMRDLMLGARKVKAKEAVEMGIVDKAVEGVEATVEAAVRMGEELVGRGWDGEIYAGNRMAMMPDVCRTVGVVTSKI